MFCIIKDNLHPRQILQNVRFNDTENKFGIFLIIDSFPYGGLRMLLLFHLTRALLQLRPSMKGWQWFEWQWWPNDTCGQICHNFSTFVFQLRGKNAHPGHFTNYKSNLGILCESQQCYHLCHSHDQSNFIPVFNKKLYFKTNQNFKFGSRPTTLGKISPN